MDIKFFKYIKDEKVAASDDNGIVVEIVADSQNYIPSFQTAGAAGADLKSAVDIDLMPMQVAMVDVGFSCKIPDGYHAKITARSSMGKKGIIVPNAPGIIDSDFVGRIRVLLLNLTSEIFSIKTGDRIAQWLIEKNTNYIWESVEVLKSTDRDPAGFGTTGK